MRGNCPIGGTGRFGIGFGNVWTHEVGGIALNSKLTSWLPVPPPAS
jgi:hypothetical protein